MLDYILILGGIQGMLLAVIILAKAKYAANRFLAAFIALLGLGCLLDNALNLVEEVYYIIIWVGNAFLFAPLLYLYVVRSVEDRRPLGLFYLHFVPFLLIKAVVLYSFFTGVLEEAFWIAVGVVLNYGLILFNFVYLYFSYRCIARFTQKRDVQAKRLILILIGIYTGYNGVFLIRRIIVQFTTVEVSLFENYLYLGVAFLIYLISAFIIYRPAMLSQQKKYSKSSIGSDESAKYGLAIENYFTTTKPYLQEDFALESISDHLQLQKQQVSQIIGEHFNMTFYELLNYYRIEEFCRRVANGAHKTKSILGVAMDCGYKSKSTFNAAFKKLKEIPPSTYVKGIEIEN